MQLRKKVIIASQPAGSEVSSLAVDAAGRVWAGTRGAGLRCYDPKTQRFWTPTTGFPQLDITGLAFDEPGNLWLATRDGVLVAGKSELAAAVGDASCAVQWISRFEGEEPGNGSMPSLLYRQGTVWVLASGRLAVVSPEIPEARPTPAPVYLESVKVNSRVWLERSAGPATRAALAEGESRSIPGIQTLEFEWTSPELGASENARFRHRLEGFDADWIAGDPLARRARYGAVPPGRYVFRVAGSSVFGAPENSTATFAFVVPVPVWQRPWAISLAGRLFDGGHVCTRAIHIAQAPAPTACRPQRSEEMSRERMRISQDMHDQIGSKLAKISYLSESVKAELNGEDAGSRSVGSLAATSRDLLRSLDQMVWAVNPRTIPWQHLADYLARHATEYFQDTAIQCEFGLPEMLPPIPLSSEVRHNLVLAFAEALTNAMKHSGGSKVRVELSIADGALRISISDNGRGYNPGYGHCAQRQQGPGRARDPRVAAATCAIWVASATSRARRATEQR